MITEELIKQSAPWFLYIFINADAPLNSSIMKKRENQITWLKRIDAISQYNYNELKQIVYNGIVEQYGKTPAKVLESLYLTSPAVSSVGTTQAEAQQITSLFWIGVKNVLDFILQIIQILGIGKRKDIEPLSSDWYRPVQTSSIGTGIVNLLPIAVGAGVLIYLFTDKD